MDDAAAPRPPREELRRLGVALEARVEAVVAEYTRLGGPDDGGLDEIIRRRFLDFVRASTAGFAHWVAGQGEDRARAAGVESTGAFGQLAAQRAASLKELVKSSLRWRDA